MMNLNTFPPLLLVLIVIALQWDLGHTSTVGQFNISVDPIPPFLHTDVKDITCEIQDDSGVTQANRTMVHAEIVSWDTGNTTQTLNCSEKADGSTTTVKFLCQGWDPPKWGIYNVRCVGLFEIDSIVYNRTGELNVTVQAKPVAALGDDCPSEYVNTTSLNCTCEMVTPGFPKVGVIIWWKLPQVFVTPTELLTVRRADVSPNNDMYKCVPNSDQGSGDALFFKARLAYGPTSVTATLPNATSPLTLQMETVNIACGVAQQSRNPGHITTLEIVQDDTANFTYLQDDTLNGVITSSYSYTLAMPGQVTAKCTARNVQFPEMKTSSTVDIEVFGLPSIKLSNCSVADDGTSLPVIGSNSSTCTCELTDPGYPPAVPKWYDETGTIVVNGTTAAVLVVQNTKSPQNFTCKAESSYGQSQELEYIASFIYGPQEVLIGMDNENVTENTLKFYCQVANSTVWPSWNTSFGVLETNIAYQQEDSQMDQVSGMSREYFVVSAISPGKYTAECTVNNSVVGSIGAVSRLEFTVTELPSADISSCSFFRTPHYPALGYAVALFYPDISVNCTCNLTNEGFPREMSRAQWIDLDTRRVVVQGNPVADLSYTRAPFEKNKNFACRAQNTVGVSERNTPLEVIYVYGPTDATIGILDTPPFDGDNTPPPANVSLYCDVPSDVTPKGGRVLFLDGDGNQLKVARMNESDEVIANVSRFEYSFSPALDSLMRPLLNTTVTCKAENIYYTPVKVEDRISLELPTLEVKDCPLNGVEACNRSASCTCRLSNPGIPHGELRWVDASGKSLKIADGSLEAKLEVDTKDHNQTFRCQAMTLWSVVEEIPFTPMFLVPPINPPRITVTQDDDVTEVSDGSTLDFSLGDTVDIKCAVDEGIPSMSNMSLTYGSESEKVIGTEVTKRLEITKDHNQAQITCMAEHESGCYNHTKTFTLNVLIPMVIVSYKINGQTTETVEVDEGNTVIFEGQAEGNPAPVLKIKGLITNASLEGQVVAETNYRFNLSVTLQSAVVVDTDTYVLTATRPVQARKRRRKRCAGDVVQSDVKKSSSLIVRGPPMEAFPEDNPPEAVVKPNGKLLAEVEVLSHPAPISYTLVRVDGDGVQATRTELPRETYVVQLEVKDCRTSVVKLSAVESSIEEERRYQFTIDNGKGDPINVLLGTRKDPGFPRERDGGDVNYGLMIGLAIVGIIVLAVIFVVIGLYCHLRSKENRMLERRKRKKQTRGGRRRVHMPHTDRNPRLWWQMYELR